jgi:hypothetical protein
MIVGNTRDIQVHAGIVMKIQLGYNCEICYRFIIKGAHGGDHPSTGDHESAYHVAKAYNTGWKEN